LAASLSVSLYQSVSSLCSLLKVLIERVPLKIVVEDSQYFSCHHMVAIPLLLATGNILHHAFGLVHCMVTIILGLLVLVSTPEYPFVLSLFRVCGY
jgi:hypothetical protein